MNGKKENKKLKHERMEVCYWVPCEGAGMEHAPNFDPHGKED